MLTKIKIKEYLFGTIATRNLTGAFSLQTGVTPTPAIVYVALHSLIRLKKMIISPD